MPYRHVVIPALWCLSSLPSGVRAESMPDRPTVCASAREQGVPGVGYAVVSASARYVGYCGTAAPDGRRPVGPDTPFEAASLSKTVFATLFVEALSPGGLSLDESLAATGIPRRVTDAETFERLTPRLVLSHQAGLPNWAGDARDPKRDDPLEFQRPPGTGFGYSGEGYELLKAHATTTLGRGLEEWFIARRDDLGMPDSSYLWPALGANGTVAIGPDGDSPRPLSASDNALAAASLITTAADYGRFLQYLLSRPELLDTLLDPQVRVDEAGTGNVSWGLGWGIYRREDNSQVAFHWGDNYQFKAFVAIDPEASRAVVFFANGYEGLRLVPTIVEPVVGELRPVRDWLGYEE